MGGLGSLTMRHSATLIAAVIIGPLAWVLIAFGQDRSAQVFATADTAGVLHGSDLVRPLLVLAAAGILLGLIATLRFSPVGAAVTGALYAASSLLVLAAPTTVLRLLRHNMSVAGWHADTSAPVRSGTSLLLGGLLLVAVVSVGRWRRWPRNEQPSSDTGHDNGDSGWPSAADPEPETQPQDLGQPQPAGVSAAG